MNSKIETCKNWGLFHSSQFPPPLAAEVISSDSAALIALPVFSPVGGSLLRNSVTSKQVHVIIFHIVSPQQRPRENDYVPCV